MEPADLDEVASRKEEAPCGKAVDEFHCRHTVEFELLPVGECADFEELPSRQAVELREKKRP